MDKIQQAKRVLQEAGYYTLSLWNINDVKGSFECTDEEAHNVLHFALNNEATMEQIWLSIKTDAESKSLTEIK
jgi:hypothetical protein